jgi:hypothetical protein
VIEPVEIMNRFTEYSPSKGEEPLPLPIPGHWFRKICALAERIARAENERDTLRARVAELEASSRWVPVSERLPKVGENCRTTSDVVMVWTDTGNIGLDYFVHTTVPYWHGYRSDRECVTHWRPLPEPPTKDGPK